MQKKRLLLIDGFNLLSRGYFATAYGKNEEDLPKTSDGLYTNALRVFFQKLFQLVSLHELTHLAVAWDVKREDSVRRQYFSAYKETRGELPEALIQQYETCERLLNELGIKQLVTPPYEADDAIGAISCLWKKQYEEQPCYIYSNDKDLLQLLNEQTTQIIAGKKGDQLYTLTNFKEDYGITPEQWIDVKALLGDKSDNIPGCPGVGEKSALPLIQQYGTIESVFEQIETLDSSFNRYKKKLLAGQDSAVLSKKLATILCEIPELEKTNFDDYILDFEGKSISSILEPYKIKVKTAEKISN
ncbi:5'-3' exonuclease [Halalkalibacter urbisdiaboli]|uniref:5'-3' exonuclease n=1 Tax=Halalkalibacter urbisdiaboli TaxID=1960589 RepID=UPI000B43E57A|nr:5'-3' exonuclease H3TH domain-containing protein [Halalkalibacter urbisdiaboli]